MATESIYDQYGTVIQIQDTSSLVKGRQTVCTEWAQCGNAGDEMDISSSEVVWHSHANMGSQSQCTLQPNIQLPPDCESRRELQHQKQQQCAGARQWRQVRLDSFPQWSATAAAADRMDISALCGRIGNL